MSRLLVPVLLVVVALALVPKDAQAPGAEIQQGIRLLGYELRFRVSVQPVPESPPAAVLLPDSLPESDIQSEEVPR